ncbi:hypothetical protein LTR28_007504 [Elasticomyces elasticus]|nr:hypothetical protein LTR28_007504 [Elasticomyces elasticus]
MESHFHRFVALFADYPKPQNDLSLLDRPAPNPNTNAPPQRTGTMPPPAHRPSRSREEEEARRRAPPRPRGPPPTFGQPDVFASPPKSENRRPRRNSESSIIDSKDKAEEERRRRERRKERELRLAREARDGKDAKPDTKQDVKSDAKQDAKGKPTKRPQGLDLIDKLDVTGIYGQGRELFRPYQKAEGVDADVCVQVFHHDGPFDACNPHRNRKQNRQAPMQAFPANSANNALGGSGPLNPRIDLDRFHGRQNEGFTDYNAGATNGQRERAKMEEPNRFAMKGRTLAMNPITINPTDRIEPVHGEESYGLGTSTFLEGAPASKTAIQRRESQREPSSAFGGNGGAGGAGITRKKSLAQRLRGISQPRRGWEPGNGQQRIQSPESRWEGAGGSPESPLGRVQSAGGRNMLGRERNPFFEPEPAGATAAGYENAAYEKKGAQVNETEVGFGRIRAPSPGRGAPLERRFTTDSWGGGDAAAESRVGGGGGGGGGGVGAGFLSRMRSLKGGRRGREGGRVS